jgi:branched-chain amino acid transport system substrate-binding protein
MAKVALLIGVSEYEQDLKPLPAAPKDVEAMQWVLQNKEIGSFDEVKPLLNPDPEAMRVEIETMFKGRKKDDLVLLFFSGHGIKDDSGKLYFATRTTRQSMFKSTAVPASFVHEIMDDCRSRRQVFILDCCFSGAFAKGLSAKDDGSVEIMQQLGGEGRVVLTSSTSTQYSFEQQGADLSIYTRHLVEGIKTGAADRDGDGCISVDELHEYAREKVQQAAPTMQPEIYAVKEGFKIWLAKVPIGDPKLKYRKQAEKLADSGEFSSVAHRILNLLRIQLGLQDKEADDIEAEVLRPYREYQEKLKEYEEALVEAIEDGYPLRENIVNHLKDYQRILGLRDEDVALIESRIISERGLSSSNQTLSMGFRDNLR